MSSVAATERPPANRAHSLSLDFWLGQIDLRPLALFRIAFALFIAYDLFDLLPIATTFFSDAGVMPRASLITQMARANRFALSDVLGPPEVVYVYWLFALVACLFVVFGYRTRIAVVVLYIFLAGFNERLPELFDGSDSVIRLTLFWLCFAPSGNAYSVDSLLARLRGTPLSPTGVALPLRIIQAQIAWVYLCSALHKTGGLTWHLTSNTGSGVLDFNNAALHYVLHLNHVFARSWAAHVADFQLPMVIGTAFTMVFEAGFVFLVFSPIANRWTKAIGLTAGVMLHGGIAATVNVGLFSYLMPVTYLAFFEPEWTQWLIDRLKRVCGQGPTTVSLDGECAVCVRGRAALEALDRFGNLKFEARSKPLAVTRPDGTKAEGFNAVLHLASRTPAGFALAFLFGIPGLKQLGALIFDWANTQQHLRAKQEGWPVEIPANAKPRPRLVPERWLRAGRDLSYLAVTLIFISAAWYAAPQPGRRYLPPQAERVVQWLSIWNIWDMFSPEPLRTDYHLAAPAEFSDGSTEDLFGGPADGPGEIRGFWFTRWWKYMENVTQGAHVIQEEWARWQCKSHNWNDSSRKLYKFRLLRTNQIIPPIGQPWPPEQTDTIVTWRCYDKPEDRQPAKTPNVSSQP